MTGKFWLMLAIGIAAIAAVSWAGWNAATPHPNSNIEQVFWDEDHNAATGNSASDWRSMTVDQGKSILDAVFQRLEEKGPDADWRVSGLNPDDSYVYFDNAFGALQLDLSPTAFYFMGKYLTTQTFGEWIAIKQYWLDKSFAYRDHHPLVIKPLMYSSDGDGHSVIR